MAQNLLEKNLTILDADVVVVSEPYRVLGDWFSDIAGDSAIIVKDKFLRIRCKGSSGYARGIVAVDFAEFSVVGCYVSPNISLESYAEFLDRVEVACRDRKGDVLVAGDFNAKATAWGAGTTDRKGQVVLEAVYRLDYTIVDTVGKYTFCRRNARSKIDFAFGTYNLVRRVIRSWVSDLYTASDHLYVVHELGGYGRIRIEAPHGFRPQSWVTEKFIEHYAGLTTGLPGPDTGWSYDEVVSWYGAITAACHGTMEVRKAFRGKGNPVGWWTPEIAEARRATIRARRLLHRRRGKKETPEVPALLSAYRQARSKLDGLIRDSKKQQWLRFVETLNRDPWGRPYKILMKSYKASSAERPDREQATSGIRSLFITEDPGDAVTNFSHLLARDLTPESIRTEDIQEAVKGIATKKATGMDCIPAEAIHGIGKRFPHHLASALCYLWNGGTMPSEWKRARLVLIPKPGKIAGEPGAYRPICVLSPLSKVWENFLKKKLEEEIGEQGLEAEQYGFRKGRATIDAVRRVVQRAEYMRVRDSVTILVTLDIQNAFNSLRWEAIIGELVNRRVSRNIVAAVRDYLSERTVVYGQGTERAEMCVYGGVPQGSIIGPLLWNLVYDGILKIRVPGVRLVAYADDLAVLVSSFSYEGIERNLATTMREVKHWLDSKGLTLATEKTEIMQISGPSCPGITSLWVLGYELKLLRAIKYLGVWLEKSRTYGKHLRVTAEKALKFMNAIGGALPNIGGAGATCRELYYCVWESIVMYASPIWADAAMKGRNRKVLESAQRLALIKVVRAYRTVSADVIGVLAGVEPMDLRVRLRNKKFEVRKQQDAELRIKNEEREVADLWQKRWQESTKGPWTRKLIPTIAPWRNRDKEMTLSFYLTQALTGHGSFGSYLCKFKKREDPGCQLCGDTEDTPEHALFKCGRFEEDRVSLATRGITIWDPGGLIPQMIESRTNWLLIKAYIEKIMTIREKEERTRERRGVARSRAISTV
ncbi:Putative 115 kDa protein in type-1 retrotransposable element R1DM [Anthophora quadrimaculata]